MHVILVEPPNDSDGYNDLRPSEGYIYPPLWALCLATYLKNKALKIKVKVNILDGQILNLSEINNIIRSIKPEIVGIGSMWVNYKNALAIARQAKRCNSRVVIGGHHATGLAREILLNRGIYSDDYCIDVVVQGDGEKAFYEYAIGNPLHKIKNLVFQDEKTRVVKFNQTEFLNLDKLSFPDRNVVDVNNYFKHSPGSSNLSYKRMFSMYSKRGCGWRKLSNGGCIFCSRMDKGLRVKNPQLVVNELNYLVTEFGADFIWDTSDNFFDSKGWFEKFYNLYKDYKLKPAMRIYARADNIDKDVVKKLNDLKIIQVALGLESGFQRNLLNMRKGITVNTNKKAVKILKMAGISIIGNFIFGAPWEDKNSLKVSTDYIYQLIELGMDIFWVYILEPLPNSLAFQLLKKKTGDKYKNIDLFDKYEVISDWVELFCEVSLSEILVACRKLQKLPNHPGFR